MRATQGFFTIERTCPTCHGAGQIIERPCRACGGQGRTRKERALNVNIPAGVEDGTRIRLGNEGEAGSRGGKRVSAALADQLKRSAEKHDVDERKVISAVERMAEAAE